MGGMITKLGTDKRGLIMCCLPIGLAEMLFGTVMGLKTGIETWEMYDYYSDPSTVVESAMDWLNAIFAGFILLIYWMATLGMLFVSCVQRERLFGWAQKGTIIVGMAIVINLFTLLIDTGINYWGEGKQEWTQEAQTYFYVDLVINVCLVAMVKFMLDAHMSGKAVVRAGGNIWTGKDADHYIAEKQEAKAGRV